MNNYYQMRMAVGMYNIGKWYDGERGWLDRRDSCTLGHLIDWSEAPPLSEEDGGV